MFEKIRNLKNKKGFTLVELIVVLVILAILAALLVPALTGYIDKAKEQSITAECRMTVMAAQTKIDELYGTAAVGNTINKNVTLSVADNTPSSFAKDTGTFTLAVSEIAALSEIKYDQTKVPKIESIEISTTSTDASKPIGKIVKLVYSNNNKTCTYENGVYTTETTKNT